MNVEAEVSRLIDTGTPPKSDKDKDKQDSERRRTATKVAYLTLVTMATFHKTVMSIRSRTSQLKCGAIFLHAF